MLACFSSILFKTTGILLPKLWEKIDQEKLLKFEAEGREFAKILRSLEQFIQNGIKNIGI